MNKEVCVKTTFPSTIHSFNYINYYDYDYYNYYCSYFIILSLCCCTKNILIKE